MKSYKQYLKEAKHTYDFRIKIAKGCTDEQVDRIERHLLKYDVQKFSAPKKLMLQSEHKDFPTMRGIEIQVIEFSTALPASAFQIQEELKKLIGIGDGLMKVRGAHEPDEQPATDKEAKSVLEDDEYSDAEKVKTDDFYGDKYNTSFVQELLKLRKEKEKGNDGNK
ncbi:MAG: hypothetical protein CBD16_05035 [Betaproteobacteria bacterium TMED156]|jgi:F0F1-type ATP synthase delta subunit|nr:MAG: hypothetical protein CBD16_05035 [Betaproteobacteria bacterium TMED156]|tara:strand:- start:318 stop:815 length:498 start_codon:yes stop_codon:yes gene_type:complete